VKPLLLLSTHSGVGKNFLLSGIIRLLSRTGIRTAPFKGCSIEQHSYILPDQRRMAFSQAIQCVAAGLPPSPLHNPILAYIVATNVNSIWTVTSPHDTRSRQPCTNRFLARQ
jgi:adenosylcobyric acid synthase